MPLIAERQSWDVVALCNSVTDVLTTSWYIVCKLNGDAGDELVRMANISTACLEEKAGSKALLLKVPASNSSRNRRLARAS